MDQLYIIVKGGCVQYVTTTSLEIINNVSVIVIDRDDQCISEESINELAVAETATYVW